MNSTLVVLAILIIPYECFAMEEGNHSDTVVDMHSLVRSEYVSFPKKKKENKKNIAHTASAIEQEIGLAKSDINIFMYFKKSHFPHIESLGPSILQQLVRTRIQDPDKYHGWEQLAQCDKDQKRSERGLFGSSKIEIDMHALLEKQTELHQLYLNALETENALKLEQIDLLLASKRLMQQQLDHLEMSNQQNIQNYQLAQKWFWWARRGSMVAGLASVVAIIISAYNFIEGYV
jgi:hypothetical protein